MAVPPAPDGQLADATTDSATSSPRTTFTHGPRLLAAFVVVILVCLASLIYLYVDQRDAEGEGGSGSEPQAQREELMAQTQQFVLRVNSFGPAWLDGENKMPRYAAGVTELMTAKFAASFEQSVVIPEQQVAQSGYGRSAEVFATGVASMDEDSATVLVGYVRTDSYPKPRDPDKRLKLPGNPERWAVELVRTEGEWLVDNYAVITEQPEGESGDQPSGDPSGTAAPGTGNGGGQQ